MRRMILAMFRLTFSKRPQDCFEPITIHIIGYVVDPTKGVKSCSTFVARRFFPLFYKHKSVVQR